MNDLAETISKAYAGVADRYEELMKGHKYFSYEWIPRHVHEIERLLECRVLDVGCGTGLNVKILGSQCAQVRADGIDVSPSMIEQARATGKYDQLYVHDLHGALSNVASDTFDLVIAFGLLEHLLHIDVCLSECRRALKVNGILWASFQKFEHEDQSLPPRVIFKDGMIKRGYSAAEILQSMSSLDMQVTELETVIGYVSGAGPCPYYVLQARKTR